MLAFPALASVLDSPERELEFTLLSRDFHSDSHDIFDPLSFWADPDPQPREFGEYFSPFAQIITSPNMDSKGSNSGNNNPSRNSDEKNPLAAQGSGLTNRTSRHSSSRLTLSRRSQPRLYAPADDDAELGWPVTESRQYDGFGIKNQTAYRGYEAPNTSVYVLQHAVNPWDTLNGPAAVPHTQASSYGAQGPYPLTGSYGYLQNTYYPQDNIDFPPQNTYTYHADFYQHPNTTDPVFFGPPSPAPAPLASEGDQLSSLRPYERRYADPLAGQQPLPPLAPLTLTLTTTTTNTDAPEPAPASASTAISSSLVAAPAYPGRYPWTYAPGTSPAEISESGDKKKKNDNQLIVRLRNSGMTFKQIRAAGHFDCAESTLRGRYRALTKTKEGREREPQWTDGDLNALCTIVKIEREKKSPAMWHRVSEKMKKPRTSRNFAAQTCSRKWKEMQDAGDWRTL